MQKKLENVQMPVEGFLSPSIHQRDGLIGLFFLICDYVLHVTSALLHIYTLIRYCLLCPFPTSCCQNDHFFPQYFPKCSKQNKSV